MKSPSPPTRNPAAGQASHRFLIPSTNDNRRIGHPTPRPACGHSSHEPARGHLVRFGRPFCRRAIACGSTPDTQRGRRRPRANPRWFMGARHVRWEKAAFHEPAIGAPTFLSATTSVPSHADKNVGAPSPGRFRGTNREPWRLVETLPDRWGRGEGRSEG